MTSEQAYQEHIAALESVIVERDILIEQLEKDVDQLQDRLAEQEATIASLRERAAYSDWDEKSMFFGE